MGAGFLAMQVALDAKREREEQERREAQEREAQRAKAAKQAP